MDSAEQAELQTFEAYCEALYNSPSADERAKAEAALVQLSTTPEYIPKCKFVLDHTQLPYAQLVATNALKKLLSSCWNHLPAATRSETRNYVLNFLLSSGPACQPFVSGALVSLVACVSKLGWSDFDDPLQVMQEATHFLQATPAHLVVGLSLLQQHVTEMNTASNTRSLAVHRKIAGSFRDGCLFQVFTAALETLRRLQARAIAGTEAELTKIREGALGLSISCLSCAEIVMYIVYSYTVSSSRRGGLMTVGAFSRTDTISSAPRWTRPRRSSAPSRCPRPGARQWRTHLPWRSSSTCTPRDRGLHSISARLTYGGGRFPHK